MEILIKNKKVNFLYIILEKIEAGISLKGTEVKSLKARNASLPDSFVKFKNGEAFLRNVHINPFKEGTYNNHEPLRERRLLLHKNEIEKLRKKVEEKGLTVVPTKIYVNNQNRIKVEIALVKGKNVHDKRHSMAERDQKRDLERTLKKGF